MSRKHYEVIAKILKNTGASQETVSGLADFFEQENPRFSKEKFFAAVWDE